MIVNPVLLSILLLAIVASILALEKQPALTRLFHYLPTPFWCYMLPMLLASAGLLPATSLVYDFIGSYVLAACLVLLLVGVDIVAIRRVGPVALAAMAVGSLGIGLGAVTSYAIFGRWLPPETWKAVGALSASWTGGSANMVAVKEALHTPDLVFAPMIVVDTFVTYSWMGLMIALAAFQDRWDVWVGADRSLLEDVNRRLSTSESASQRVSESVKPLNRSLAYSLTCFTGLVGGAMAIGAVCFRVGRMLPPVSSALNPAAVALLLVTTLGIGLSLTPARQLENFGASRWGNLCLYLLLASIGSKAHLQYLLQTPILIGLAVVWVSIHAGLLIAYGKFFRIPMFFLVASSQANIGGTASAPIVSGIYQPRLASVGLLLAISANVIGTYIGLLIAHACHWVYR